MRNPPAALDISLYRADQMRALDGLSAKAQSISSFELMQRAGRAASQLLHRQWPDRRNLAILAGPGNNGGDGYVVGREALEAGSQVTLIQIADPALLRGDALLARNAYLAAGGVELPYEPGQYTDCELIVDAIFGTGLSRPVKGVAAQAIAEINNHAAPVLSLDIPSGLNSDSGVAMGETVVAHTTISFVAYKRGLFTGQAADYCGAITLASLGTRESVIKQLPTDTRLISALSTEFGLPARTASSHKGNYGHLAIIGGDHGMPGAAWLAGMTALRVGAGRVSLATRSSHVHMVNACPELMLKGIESLSDLDQLLEKTDVIGIGPGLGCGAWGQALLNRALQSDQPKVLDADALNLLARLSVRSEDWILTPHPGEAARLLGCTTKEVQSDRYAAATSLQQKFGGTVVLKGSGTIVRTSDCSWVCRRGNVAMATAGMGDVLTGLIAALVAQGMNPEDAAIQGVELHAEAGDRAARGRHRGLIASDLLEPIAQLVSPHEQ